VGGYRIVRDQSAGMSDVYKRSPIARRHPQKSALSQMVCCSEVLLQTVEKGHSRRGRTSSRSGHVRCAPESGGAIRGMASAALDICGLMVSPRTCHTGCHVMPNARRFPPPWTIGEKTTPASWSATTTARARLQDHFSNNFRGDGCSVDVCRRLSEEQSVGGSACH
jgi:hypothetical protein